MKMKFRCYACGKALGKTFYLTSMQDEGDRAFLIGPECVARVDDPTCKVERTP